MISNMHTVKYDSETNRYKKAAHLALSSTGNQRGKFFATIQK